eukprot:TRINITY_DN41399_c0_g1_i1.p1 TRINITY_DN41399_c0_g1~~TRINITY_DN41399_c0_g1_i1.p1  ORF type:complete len:223 (-),score=31.92 TRINITY_DN41399_c0_g1_i1:248-916(-)
MATLPSNGNYQPPDQPCAPSVAVAVARMFECLTEVQLNYNGAAQQQIARCGCFFAFMQKGKDCDIATDTEYRNYAYEFGANHTAECQHYWEDWGLGNPPAPRWWATTPGMICQALILLVLLALCLWGSKEICRGFLERNDRAAEVVLRVAPAPVARILMPKRLPPVDETETSEEEPVRPSLKQYKVHQDHQNFHRDYHPQSSATHLPMADPSSMLPAGAYMP